MERLWHKALRWIGPSRSDLKDFPEPARKRVGGALWEAQLGGKSSFAKPLKGFKGASVLEIVSNFDGDTFRAVYTVQFEEAIYVLHAFQKKAKHGVATPKHELDLIEQRLKQAVEEHETWLASGKPKAPS